VYTVPPPEDELLYHVSSNTSPSTYLLYPDYFGMFEINENYFDHFIYGVILLSPQVYHDE